MRSVLPILLLSLAINEVAATQCNDINDILKNVTIEIPKEHLAFLVNLLGANITSIELNDLTVESGLTNATHGWMRAELDLKHVTVLARLRVIIKDKVEVNLDNVNVTLVASLWNPDHPLSEADATNVSANLFITWGHCHISGLLDGCNILRDQIRDHRSEIDKGVGNLLEELLVNGSRLVEKDVLPNPWELAVEQSAPFENIPGLVSFNDSFLASAANFVANDILGAKDDENNTAFGHLLDSLAGVPLTLNHTIWFSNATDRYDNIVLKDIILKNATVPVFQLQALTDRSFMLSMELSNTTARIVADVNLLGDNCTYNRGAWVEVERLQASFNISMMLAVNASQYGDLPLATLIKTATEQLENHDLEAVPLSGLLNSIFADTALECWVEYPAHGLNLSTLTINLMDYAVTDFVLNDELSIALSNAANAVKTFIPHIINSLIHTEVNTITSDIDDFLASNIVHKDGPNPCAYNGTVTPVVPPTYNYSDSEALAVLDFLINDVGAEDINGIDHWLQLLFAGITIHEHWHIHQPKYIGDVDVQLDNLKINATNFFEFIRVLQPNGTSTLDNHVVFGKTNVSIDIFFSISGDDQDDFHNNFTLSLGFESFNLVADVTAVVNATRLMMLPLDMLAQPGCAMGLLDKLEIPYINGLMNVFAADVICNDCMSPGFNDLQGTLTTEPGRTQVSVGVQDLLNRANTIANNAVFQKFLQDGVDSARRQCDTGVSPAPSNSGNPRDGPMTNAKAYAIVFGWAGTLAFCLLLYSPWVYFQWKRDKEERGEKLFSSSEELPLIFHPSMPAYMRYGVFLALLGTVGCFLSSNLPPLGIGATVHANLTIGGSMVHLDNLFVYALANTIRDMWNGSVYALSLLVCALSGMWPYSKMVLLIWSWCVPPCVLSAPRRVKLLEILDFGGKWSLIDSFMVIMMMVAFRLHIQEPNSWAFLPGEFIVMDIIVTPGWGLFGFMTAAILSLTINHLMVMCHRNAVDYDESKGESEGWFNEVNPEMSKDRIALCNWSNGEEDGHTRCRTISLVAFLVLALGLLIAGAVLDTFTFEFEGLAAIAVDLDQPNSAKTGYSVMNLAGEVIKQASINDMEFAYWYLVIGFLLFAFIVPVLQVILLLAMWALPLTLREQKILFFVNEIVAAWCATEVFVVVLIAVMLQIGKFAQFLIGNSCNGINRLFGVVQSLGYLTDQETTCFDVKAQLSHGCWILFGASFCSNVGYIIAWKYAALMIERRHTHHEASSPLIKQKHLQEFEDEPVKVVE